MRRGLWIAIAIGAVGCGRSESKQTPAPAPKPAPVDHVPIARPSRVPAFVTLDELAPKHPALTGARVAVALALDESGKQALATACVTGADADATARTIADQYTAAGWQAPALQHGAFTADLDLADGALHVQGRIRKDAACHDDELAVAVAYTKMVPISRTAPPATDSDRVAH